MSDDPTTDTGDQPSWPEKPPPEERSLELPAVIIGERGDRDEQLDVRLLPGRLPKYWILYPAYAAVGLAGLLATHFALRTAEWHPLMTIIGWGLLFCWYWVYGVGYHYRRRVMKYFACAMATVTAGSLTLVAAVRAKAMAVPTDDGLVMRSAQPLLMAASILTTLSLVAVFVHVVYLGRGYREKRLHDKHEKR